MDDIEFQFTRYWQQPSHVDGQLRDHMETETFEIGSSALEAHHQACRGGWVTGRMRKPHVGPLKVLRGGTVVGERRPSKDLPGLGHTSSWSEELPERAHA